VALLDHDAARAKQVFGRLTAGEHAATQDPMVLAWSHVYLARIYGDEGNPEVAKLEYQSVLNVEGGPEQAKLAAQKDSQHLAEIDPWRDLEREAILVGHIRFRGML